MEQNMEEVKYSMPHDNLVVNASELDKATFYRKTYMHVGLAILVFMAIESVFLKIPAMVNFMYSMLEGYKWLLVLGLFWLGSSMANRLAYAENKSTQYLGLVFYAALEALIFLPLIAITMSMEGGTAVLNQAALITLALFGALTAVVFMSKTNFSFLKSFLVIGSFIAVGAIVAGMIFEFNLGLWFSVAMVVLASGAILYQTSKIKYEFQPHQYIGAAIGVFASIMLLFWYILRILLSRR